MSGNRRKNTLSHTEGGAENTAASRLVAIPKTPEQGGAKVKPERIGDVLRQARLARGDDLLPIAEYLCIKPAFLIALENSHYDEIPADAYVIGFLRTYANFLGIDGKEAIERYRYEMAGRRKKPVLSMPHSLSEGRTPSALLLVAATIAALLVYALWYGISSTNRTQVSAPPVVPMTAVSGEQSAAAGLSAPVEAVAPPAPVAAPVAVATPDTTSATATIAAAVPEGIVVTAAKNDAPAPEANPKKRAMNDGDTTARIVIRATQSSWVMITDSAGNAIFDHAMKAGDTYRVPNKSGLSLTTGNGNGLVLSLDGVDLPKISTGAPHVVRDISLDPERLTTQPPAN